MNNGDSFSSGVIVGSLFGAILTGIVFGFVGKGISNSMYERTLVDFDLAHYNDKTKEFVLDYVGKRNDSTIIIKKKD